VTEQVAAYNAASVHFRPDSKEDRHTCLLLLFSDWWTIAVLSSRMPGISTIRRRNFVVSAISEMIFCSCEYPLAIFGHECSPLPLFFHFPLLPLPFFSCPVYVSPEAAFYLGSAGAL